MNGAMFARGEPRQRKLELVTVGVQEKKVKSEGGEESEKKEEGCDKATEEHTCKSERGEKSVHVCVRVRARTHIHMHTCRCARVCTLVGSRTPPGTANHAKRSDIWQRDSRTSREQKGLWSGKQAEGEIIVADDRLCSLSLGF